MATTKIAKKLPKRAASSHLKDARKRRWATGKERKAARVAKNEAQAKANAATPGQLQLDQFNNGKLVPSSLRRRVRPRRDRDGNPTNMKTCLRCANSSRPRQIVAGSVCICRAIGASTL